MSELHHDEIKGPPSTQTDFVNFLAVISGNYNYEITISFAPETRVIRGWIIVSPKLLANELPPEAVLPRIINWPQQKALNATESPNHVAWVCNNRKWRNVATFVTFFHEQWEISSRYLHESTFLSNRVLAIHLFVPRFLFQSSRHATSLKFRSRKTKKWSHIEWRCIGFRDLTLVKKVTWFEKLKDFKGNFSIGIR